MVFAPKLEGGVAYNQPIETPNAMSAVANLFNFGLQAAAGGKTTETKLTEDEKFAVAIREFEESKGATFTWNRASGREFIFKYPQFEPQTKSWLESQGVMTKAPQEASRDALMEWAKTPEGVVAAAMTSNMTPDEGAAFMAQAFTEIVQQQAEIAKLERNVARLNAEGTLEAKRWDAIAPTQKSMVDNAVTGILGPIVQTVKEGGTVEVTPELAEMLGGLPFNQITMTNLPLFLSTAKIALSNQGQQSFSNNFGYDALPSEDWNKKVYGSIDGLIKIAEEFDSPQEAAAAMNALIEADALRKLDERGVSTAVYLAKILPPETFSLMIGDTNDMMDRLGGILISDNGQLFSTKDIKGNVVDMSKKDAEALAKDTVNVLSYTMDKGVFTAFNAAREKSGYNVMDGESFNVVIGKNATRIIELAKGDAEFKTEVQDTLVSDIQQTITIVKNNLPATVELVQQGGKFSVRMKDSYRQDFEALNTNRIESSLGAISEEEFIASQVKDLPLGVDALNQKVSTLSILGPVGKEVQEAVGLLNTQTGSDIFGKIKNIQPTQGTVTKSSKNSPRDVGAELGIDFGAYEADNALPPGYLNRVAMIESGGNPSADNPMSSAGGLFQQIDSNAKAYGVSDRYDPVQSTEGAVRFAVDNMNYLTRVLGREPTGGELYLAHQQGPGGAAKLLSNPDALAVDIVGVKAVEQNGGSANMTAGEFANIWISKYNGSRGQTSVASAATPSIRSDSSSIDSAVMTGGTPLNMPVEAVGGATEGLTAEQVAQLVERVKQAPEQAVQIVQEAMAGRPMDPMIKALIEALVGGKA
jgi:hypothetical protein